MAMLELDESGVVQFVNVAAIELLGIEEPDDVVGTHYSDWIEPARRRGVRDGIAAAFQGRPRELALRTDAPGGRKPCRARFLPLPGIPRIVATLFDRSTELAAAEALQRSEARLRQVLDLVPHLVFAKDRSGRFLLANRATAERLGKTPEQLIGLSHADLHTGEAEDERFRRDDLEVISTGRPKVIPEEELTHADGTVSYLQTTKIPFVRVGTDEPAVLGLAIDVTERRRKEQERARLEEKLRQRQKLESLGVLAGGIAHDFNNLLQSIRGHADLLREEVTTTPSADGLFDQIDAAAEQASKLCLQMLAYSGQGSFVVGDTDVNALLEESTKLLGVTLGDEVELDFDLAPELPAVHGDATQLTQLVMNLVANASDAIVETGRPGRIRLRTRARSLGARDLGSLYVHDEPEPGRFVVLEVEDDGVGMEPETLERLFDPFYSTKFPGRGLGLSAVLGIVRGHGGTLQVDSRPGAGTCFRVLLPESSGGDD